MFGEFVTPVAGWHPPLPAAKTLATPPSKPAEIDWRDHASEERWAEAILT
jgi:hypothetical protein